MPIPIPSAQKPIQLYIWPKCGFCTKQKQVISSMDTNMTNWFNRNVRVTTVEDPKRYPMVKGYPFWVVSGKQSPGFKTIDEIVSMSQIVR